ncbi:LytTR family transcriptional regulator DNA-binding domain-containing protein [Geomicrobium sp. JSM 1781026]|uniref:LytTR family transcriptional regulator DNA-binding domain-containing protein n=1 Tax=Geomicrobium sp. JSM 1781026 TaxID=3344580 RepID=UPI0035C1AF38
MSLFFHFNEKLQGNTVRLPEADFTVVRGEAVALHGDTEWLEPFHECYVDPSFVDVPVPNRFIFFQSDGLYTRLTPRKHLHLWASMYGRKREEADILRACGLTDVADRRIKRLTAMQKRRLHYARALIMPADVYLFDQPIIGVDRETKQVFQGVLERLQKRYVVLTSTSLEEAVQYGKPYRLHERGLSSQTEEVTTGSPLKLEKISAKVDDKFILFDPLEIDYVESKDGHTFIHVNQEVFVSALPLKELESRLVPYGFYRSHRAFVVNLQRVREVIVWSKNSYSLRLGDRKKSEVPLSKGNYSTLRDMLKM